MANPCLNSLVIYNYDAATMASSLFDAEGNFSLEHLSPLPEGVTGNAHWGTRFAELIGQSEEKDGALYLALDSPWSPPTQWLECFAAKFPQTSGRMVYTESGNAVFGCVFFEEGSAVDETAEALAHIPLDPDDWEEFEIDERFADSEIQAARLFLSHLKQADENMTEMGKLVKVEVMVDNEPEQHVFRVLDEENLFSAFLSAEGCDVATLLEMNPQPGLLVCLTCHESGETFYSFGDAIQDAKAGDPLERPIRDLRKFQQALSVMRTVSSI